MSALRELALEVHKLLQDTEAYAAYAAKVARRYRQYDITAKWIVAAAACGPFVDKLQSTSTNTASWFLALVPLLALSLPLVNFSRVIQLASELHGKLAEILLQLKKIWRDVSVSSDATAQTIEQLKKDINDIDVRLAATRPKRSEMPEVKSLIVQAEKDCVKYPLPPWLQKPPTVKEPSPPDKQPKESPPSYSGGSGGIVTTYTKPREGGWPK